MMHAVGHPPRRAARPTDSGQKDNDLDLHRQLAVVRTWLPLIVLTVALAGGVAYAVSSVVPKTYEAKSTLIIGQSLSAVNPDFGQLQVSQRLATTYATIATTRPILASVIEQLDLDITTDDLASRMRADAAPESTLLTIKVQDGDAKQAAEIANALANQLIAASPTIQGRQVEFQKSIEADLKATQALIDSTQVRVEALTTLTDRTAAQDAELAALEGRLVNLRSTYTALLAFSANNASNLLSVIEPAIEPPNPESPKPLLNTVMACLLGLLVAAGVISIAERLDDKVKDPDGVREYANMSTLGTITRMKGGRGRGEIYRLATVLYPRSSVAEAYRTLRSNVEFASVDTPIRTLLVTSSIPREGKTVTAANLAVAFAQAGRRVLLVDADLRKPGVHLVFDLPNEKGLTSLLLNDDFNLERIIQPTEQPNLRVLTTGPLPPNPAELLGSKRMRTVLDRLQAGTDLVVFDSPPLQAVTDAAVLSSFFDGTIFVIDALSSPRRSVRLGREALERAGANILGAVLNRSPGKVHADYGDYYGDATTTRDDRSVQARDSVETPSSAAF